jgi:hypothetical protein
MNMMNVTPVYNKLDPFEWLCRVKQRLGTNAFEVGFVLARHAAKHGEKAAFPPMADIADQAGLPECRAVKGVSQLIAGVWVAVDDDIGSFHLTTDEIPF